MPATVVLGAQWGDEGKAKIVDYLAAGADVVVRFQGGANAGHTVEVGGETWIFHTLPVGVLNDHAVCVVGNGVVLDPESLFSELDELAGRGVPVSPGRLRVSGCAHVVLPYHKALDRASEESLGSGAIGTTARGIGPAYRDKVARSHALRVMDLLDADLRDRLRSAVRAANDMLTRIYGAPTLDVEEVVRQTLGFSDRLRPYVDDTSVYLNKALDEGRRVLFEGAQGTLLDIDHGTYPYVTSSNTTAGGACTGTGVGPTRIDEIIGVTKAYMTRVGNGPFPRSCSTTRGSGSASWARSTAPPRAAPAAAAGSTPPSPAWRRGSTASPAWPSPASTSSTRWSASSCAPPTATATSCWRSSPPTRGSSTSASPCTRRSTAGARRPPAPAPSPTCPPGPAPTCAASRS